MMSQAVSIVLMLVSGSYVAADVVLAWNTSGNTGAETSQASTTNLYVAPASLTFGSITAATNANRFGGSNWFDTGDTAAGTTLTESIAGNDYVQFVVAPTQAVTLISFDFRWDRSNTGPSLLALRSSADGFTATLGSVVSIPNTGAAQIAVLNSITLGNLHISGSTTFRLYGFGATGTSGTGGFDTDAANSASPNVVLNGITAVPEPSSLLCVGATIALVFYRRVRARRP